mgnify:CR=1 FL=1
MKRFFGSIKRGLIRFCLWILGWFEKHQTLHVRQNQYNSEGEVVDVIVRTFEVRKFYKCTAKHMKFKTQTGTMVEIKTATPMDYLTETIR